MYTALVKLKMHVICGNFLYSRKEWILPKGYGIWLESRVDKPNFINISNRRGCISIIFSQGASRRYNGWGYLEHFFLPILVSYSSEYFMFDTPGLLDKTNQLTFITCCIYIGTILNRIMLNTTRRPPIRKLFPHMLKKTFEHVLIMISGGRYF